MAARSTPPGPDGVTPPVPGAPGGIPEVPQAPSAAPTGPQRSPYAAPAPTQRSPYAPPGPGPAAPGAPGAVPNAIPAIAKPPLDGVSVAAVVTGVLGLGPVALTLGVIGLRRTTKSWLRSPTIAGVGLGLGIVGTLAWIGLAIAAALGAFSGPSTQSVPGDVAAPRTVHASALAAGNCIQTLPPQQEVGEVNLVPCDTEHLAQVLSVIAFDPTATYPGPEAALTAGEELCADAYDSLDEARYLRWVLVPTPQAWDDGVRAVACIARSQMGQVTTDLVN